jgi:hypothetical protein
MGVPSFDIAFAALGVVEQVSIAPLEPQQLDGTARTGVVKATAIPRGAVVDVGPLAFAIPEQFAE